MFRDRRGRRGLNKEPSVRYLFAASLVAVFSIASIPAQEAVDLAMAGRIREEGLQRSRAQELYLTLSDAIGARLTGSPSHVRAALWASDRLTEWGLANARLEPFQFGRGWSLEKISVEMMSPRYMPLIAYADAWTPSIAGVLTGRALYIGDKTAADIAGLAPQLRGAIVLAHLPQTQFIDTDRPQPGLSDQPVRTGNPASPSARSTIPTNELLPLLQRAGARVLLKPSAYRDGTVGVLGNRNTTSDAVPSITIAAEQYNMLARLAAANVPVELRIELRTRYQEEDLNTYNVIADIPGTDPDRKSTRLNSSHGYISYAVFCLKKKTYKRSDVMSKGKKRSGSRPCRPQPLRGTKGKRKGARLLYIGGQQF